MRTFIRPLSAQPGLAGRADTLLRFMRGSTATNSRAVPAPGFQAPPPPPFFPSGAGFPHRTPVQQHQQQHRPEELDYSFVGKTGGEIFHECMLRHSEFAQHSIVTAHCYDESRADPAFALPPDVKHVFGYPGGAILPVFDAIYNSEHFDFVLPRHEQGAGHSQWSSNSLDDR